MTNTAAPVSLILLGSQTIRAHSEVIHRAMDPSTSPIEDVGVHHRGAYIPVSEQLLNCPDVVAVFKQMRGKGVSEGVAGGPLDNPWFSHAFLDGALDGRFMNMMASLVAGLLIDPPMVGGEHVLPAPFGGGVRVLASQREGHVDAPPTVLQVALVNLPNMFQPAHERPLDGLWQHGEPVFGPFAVL